MTAIQTSPLFFLPEYENLEPANKKQKTTYSFIGLASNRVPLPIKGEIPYSLKTKIDLLEYRLYFDKKTIDKKCERSLKRAALLKYKSAEAKAWLLAHTGLFQGYINQFVEKPPFQISGTCVEWLNLPEEKRPPNLTLETANLPSVGMASTIGFRSAMEDELLATRFCFKVKAHTKQATLLAVFDGHGGARTAEFSKENLEGILKCRLEEFSKTLPLKVSIWNALKIACVDLSRKTPCPVSGSTASIALIIDQKVWAANIGDSRILLTSKEGKTIPLSEEASLYLPHYVRKAEKRGCKVLIDENTQQRTLAVNYDTEEELELVDSPSGLGENCLGCSARPKIVQLYLPVGSILTLASDGGWDVAKLEQVSSLFHRLKTKGIKDSTFLAAAFTTAAYCTGSRDNISTLVYQS